MKCDHATQIVSAGALVSLY